jgi:small subunit ribosomal protein S18
VARNNDRDRGRRAVKDARPTRGKKKACIFCSGKVEWVDYKDINTLRRFTSDRGKIRARRVTGNCAQHQRDVAVAVKTARELALLPYTQRTVTERGPGRGPRGDRERPRATEEDTDLGENVADELELDDEVEAEAEGERVLSEVE